MTEITLPSLRTEEEGAHVVVNRVPRRAVPDQTFANTVLLGLATLLAVSIAGCGQQLPYVSGSVTLDGNPVRGSDNLQCVVLFFPEGGNGAPAVAVVDGSGNYILDTGSTRGALEGKYGVAITVAEFTPSQEGGLPRIRQLAPPKYADPSTSGWSVDVVPGSNDLDFAIETQDEA